MNIMSITIPQIHYRQSCLPQSKEQRHFLREKLTSTGVTSDLYFWIESKASRLKLFLKELLKPIRTNLSTGLYINNWYDACMTIIFQPFTVHCASPLRVTSRIGLLIKCCSSPLKLSVPLCILLCVMFHYHWAFEHINCLLFRGKGVHRIFTCPPF